jgi:long-chain acyl-CoA synthetase
MSISLLLEMAVSDVPDRLAVVSNDVRLTTQELSDLADGAAGVIAASGCEHVAYVGAGGAMLPLLLFASARAGRTFTPINYRLSAEGIQALIDRLPSPLVIVDARYREMIGSAGKAVQDSDEFLAAARTAEPAWCCSPRAPHRRPRPLNSRTTTSPVTSPAPSSSVRPNLLTPP